MPTGARARAEPAPAGRSSPRLRGRALAEQILAVVTEIEQLPVRRGRAYRQQVLALAELCNGTTAILGDLLGVSQQAAWETLHRARQDERRTASNAGR
jgi:hypothetical protein